MNWLSSVRSIDDVRRAHYRQIVWPGDPEPEWLRRQAEYARELPLLRAEQKQLRRGGSQRTWSFSRLWASVRS